VLIVPYAYATTQASWAFTKGLGANKIVLVHMPEREADTIGLWDAVKSTAGFDEKLLIPVMGQQLLLE